MRVFEFILDIFGWILITLAPTFGASLIALVVYLKWTNKTGGILAISIISLGFIFGAICATRIWKKHGTMAWLSQIRKIS